MPKTHRRHNLCLFTNCFGHGGTEHQFAEIASRLDQSKYNLKVACFSRTGEFLNQVTSVGVPVTEFVRGRWFDPRTAACAHRWMRFVRRERIALVHTFDFHTTVFAAIPAKLAGVRRLVTSRRNLGTTLHGLRHWALRRLFCWSDCVVANSEAARQNLLMAGVSARLVHVVRNGVDLKRFSSNGHQASARLRWGWREEELLIGVIANLRPEKGHATLLKAVPTVVKRFPQAHFLIAGPDPLKQGEHLRAMASNLSSHVSFLGDCCEVPELLAALDIFVLPSLSESLPNALMEAMSAGRPVIASAVGGCSELVVHGQTGMLVPPQDPEALAQQIVRLLEEPELRERLGRAARKRAESEFDIKKAVERLETIYDELLEGVCA
jgi:glycosyltransferase involved in cell wall biosynthesis